MRLHEFTIGKTGTRKPHRVGRGRANGRGKTCGRGHNGQKSRSGFSQRPGFESGHVPLFRRLPIRGFNNFNFRTTYATVNVGDLEGIEKTDEIDRKALTKAGLIRANAKLIKILGNGEVKKALKVKAHKFSVTAREKLEKAGGKAILIDAPKAKPESAKSKSAKAESAKPESAKSEPEEAGKSE